MQVEHNVASFAVSLLCKCNDSDETQGWCNVYF